ncbi:MAG: hypothetical protein WC817_03660 [Patescibacteria group bacterium]|jgi:hypothetical protein
MNRILADVPFLGWFTSSRGEGELALTEGIVEERLFTGARGRYDVAGTYPISGITRIDVRPSLVGIFLLLLAIACVPASLYWNDPWFAYGAWGFWTLAHRYNRVIVMKTTIVTIKRTIEDQPRAERFKDAVLRALADYRTHHCNAGHEVLR